MIANDLGELLTPSVVGIDRSGSLVVGRSAKDLLAVSPRSAASQFKRDMGSSTMMPLNHHNVDPITLSACVLESLRKDAERALDESISRAVITVPAYFNENQRYATKCAAELAGLTVERILNEPTAAAIAYGLDRREDETQFLVFDLGGGTFDVCVMELFDGMLAVKSVAGGSRLGGEDFTRLLLKHVCVRGSVDAARLYADTPTAFSLLYSRCELAKRHLSSSESTTVTIPAIEGQRERPLDLKVTREEAELAYAPLVDQLLGPCRSALRGARLKPRELDEVVLVGGATRMPVVRGFVEEMFERRPIVDIDPDLVVAHGAAVQASLCLGDSAVGDIVVTDVASHSVGVDRPRQRGARWVPGNFTPIIHRNTVIPSSRSETIQLAPRERVVHVYEGESLRVEDNTHIGSIPIAGQLRGKDEVELRFTYDTDGILEVEAEVVATKKKVKRVFNRPGQKVRRDLFDSVRAQFRRLRTSRPGNAKSDELLARANYLLHEAGGRQEQLRGAIDALEAALLTHHRGQIDECVGRLESICVELDGGERW